MSGTKDHVNQAGFLLRYSLQSFGIVIVLAILIRTFVISSYVMSGTSMVPTIWPGDFLLAGKWGVHRLQRGDVVALRCPLVHEKLCLKRIVGLPGDRVDFQSGQLLVNGQKAHYRPNGPYQVESVAGQSWIVWGEPQDAGLSLATVVPPATVYLLNDKRSDHEDSRTWGPVSEDLLEGKVKQVWMSLDWFDGERVRSWPRVRWERLFRAVD